MRRLQLATVLIGTLAFAMPAMAESSDTDSGSKSGSGSSVLNVPREQWQTPGQISDKLVGQGYKVHEIEAEDRAYEVKVTDKNGVRIKMYVHPATGEVLPGTDD